MEQLQRIYTQHRYILFRKHIISVNIRGDVGLRRRHRVCTARRHESVLVGIGACPRRPPLVLADSNLTFTLSCSPDTAAPTNCCPARPRHGSPAHRKR